MGIISSIFHYDVVETSTPPYLFIHLLAFNGFFGFFEMIDKFGFDGCFFGGCFTFQNGQIGSLAHLHFTLVCFHTIISHLCFIIIKLSWILLFYSYILFFLQQIRSIFHIKLHYTSKYQLFESRVSSSLMKFDTF